MKVAKRKSSMHPMAQSLISFILVQQEKNATQEDLHVLRCDDGRIEGNTFFVYHKGRNSTSVVKFRFPLNGILKMISFEMNRVRYQTASLWVAFEMVPYAILN